MTTITDMQCNADTSSLAIVTRFGEIETAWRRLEATAPATPFQTYDVCAAWWTHIGRHKHAQLALVTGRSRDGQIDLILPLYIRQLGPIRVAMWIGDSHFTYKTALMSTDRWAALQRSSFQTFWFAITNLLPSCDAVYLNDQPVCFAGLPNPFVDVRAVARINATASTRLRPSFPAFEQQTRTAKARSRDRNRLNRLRKKGAVAIFPAQTGTQAETALDAMLQHKADWLTRSGRPNFCADKRQVAFLRALATLPDDSSAAPLISILSVDDAPVATSLALFHQGVAHGMILAVNPETADATSPGRILLRAILEHCCAQQMTAFDFGSGNNDIKASWADNSTILSARIDGVTARGYLFAACLRMWITIRRTIKTQPKLTSLLLRVRAALSTRRLNLGTQTSQG